MTALIFFENLIASVNKNYLSQHCKNTEQFSNRHLLVIKARHAIAAAENKV